MENKDIYCKFEMYFLFLFLHFNTMCVFMQLFARCTSQEVTVTFLRQYFSMMRISVVHIFICNRGGE